MIKREIMIEIIQIYLINALIQEAKNLLLLEKEMKK